MFTIHPHSSKSEPEKLSAVIGCRDGGKFGWSRKAGGNSQSFLLSALSCAVSCLWARFWSQEAKMLLASPAGILLCTVFISSSASASTEMVTVNFSLWQPLDTPEMWTWAGRVKWRECITLQHTALCLTACNRTKQVKLCHHRSWCFTKYLHAVADISTANTQRPVFPGKNTITYHTFLVAIRMKIKSNISLGHTGADVRLWLAHKHQFGVRKKWGPIILDSLNTHIHRLGTKFCH